MSDSDSDESGEADEPLLKYQRIGASVTEILQRDRCRWGRRGAPRPCPACACLPCLRDIILPHTLPLENAAAHGCSCCGSCGWLTLRTRRSCLRAHEKFLAVGTQNGFVYPLPILASAAPPLPHLAGGSNRTGKTV